MADEDSRFKMEILDEIVERYPPLKKVNERGESYVVETTFLPFVPIFILMLQST